MSNLSDSKYLIGILDACTDGKCVCPPNKSGTDCSEINPCFGANGWICIGGSTSVLCFNDDAVKSFSCPNGCDVRNKILFHWSKLICY